MLEYLVGHVLRVSDLKMDEQHGKQHTGGPGSGNTVSGWLRVFGFQVGFRVG